MEQPKYTIVKMRDKLEVDWSVAAVLHDFDAAGLLSELQGFLPVRLFCHARKELTGEGDYLEIKGMADNVVAVKSRGQIGVIPVPSDDGPIECISILAKFSIKPPLQDLAQGSEEYKFIYETDGVKRQVEGEYLLNHFTETEAGRDEIMTYKLYSLPSAGKIMKSGGELDLVQQVADRAFNCDFDFKRYPLVQAQALFAGGPVYEPPHTLPFESLAVMKPHRYQAENIRRTGRVARVPEVLDRVRLRGRKTRAEGGEAAHAVRLFLRGVLRGHLATTGTTDDYPAKVEALNAVWGVLPASVKGKKEAWRVNDLKNNRRGAFEKNCIRRVEFLMRLVSDLCPPFGVAPDSALELLFDSQNEQLNMALVVEVVTAILHGACMEPFSTLLRENLLPGRQELLLKLAPTLTADIITACESALFIPGRRHRRDRDELARLFRRLRIPEKHITACVSCLIDPEDKESRPGKYSVSKAVLENTVCWLVQPDSLSARHSHSWIKSVLRPCGLTDRKFDQLKNERFIPHRVTNTARNRGYVDKIAKLLRVDPAAIVAAVIDK